MEKAIIIISVITLIITGFRGFILEGDILYRINQLSPKDRDSFYFLWVRLNIFYLIFKKVRGEIKDPQLKSLTNKFFFYFLLFLFAALILFTTIN